MTKKYLTIEERVAHRSLEDVVGCRWSTAVVGAIQDGIKRPGKLRRYIPGISTKVLNERLKKLLDYGLATREDFSESSLHVEYSLTSRGKKLALLIEQLRDLDDEYQAEEKSRSDN